MITKSGDRAAGVQFVYHEYDITDRIGRHEVLIPINYKKLQFQSKEEYQGTKEREYFH